MKNKQHKDRWVAALDVIKPIVAVGFSVGACFIFDDVLSNLIASFAGYLLAMCFFEIVAKIKLRLEDRNKIATDDFSYDKATYLYDVNVGKETTHIWYYPLVNDVNASYKVVDEPRKYFQLDNFLINHYTMIMQAHQASFLDNPTMIRLDDCVQQPDGTYNLHTSRTPYFNDLVTNRSMDYKFSGNLTIRNVYESGKHLTPLGESKMSNHIGVIAHVFYGGKEILAQRGGTATISKNKFTTCVAAGLSLDDVRTLLNDGQRHPKIASREVLDGVLLLKLADRLNLEYSFVLDLCKQGKIKLYLMGLGQIVYTGGKPQFYYAVVIDPSVDLSEINARPVNKHQIDYNKRMVTASGLALRKGYTLSLQCDGIGKLKGEAEKSFYIGLWHIQTQKRIYGIPDWVYEKKAENIT